MDHKLSEEQMNQLADKVCQRLEQKLYLNIGSGVLNLVWKGIVVAMIAVAAYGFGVKHW